MTSSLPLSFSSSSIADHFCIPCLIKTPLQDLRLVRTKLITWGEIDATHFPTFHIEKTSCKTVNLTWRPPPSRRRQRRSSYCTLQKISTCTTHLNSGFRACDVSFLHTDEANWAARPGGIKHDVRRQLKQTGSLTDAWRSIFFTAGLAPSCILCLASPRRRFPPCLAQFATRTSPCQTAGSTRAHTPLHGQITARTGGHGCTTHWLSARWTCAPPSHLGRWVRRGAWHSLRSAHWFRVGGITRWRYELFRKEERSRVNWLRIRTVWDARDGLL